MSIHNKQRRKEKKRQLELMKKNLPGEKLVHSPPGMEKMSQVIEDFMEPYLADFPEFEKLVPLAIVAWNACLVPPDSAAKILREAENLFPQDCRDVFQELMASMMARKRQHFASNQRIIFNYTLTPQADGDLYLQIASSMAGGQVE